MGLVRILAVALAAGLLLSHAAGARPFDAQRWRSADIDHNDRIRLTMVDELVQSRRLVGLSREEAIALLGEPTTTDKFQDWDLVYWVGPERGYFSIDSEWLVMRFDAQGRVSQARDVRD